MRSSLFRFSHRQYVTLVEFSREYNKLVCYSTALADKLVFPTFLLFLPQRKGSGLHVTQVTIPKFTTTRLGEISLCAVLPAWTDVYVSCSA